MSVSPQKPDPYRTLAISTQVLRDSSAFRISGTSVATMEIA